MQQIEPIALRHRTRFIARIFGEVNYGLGKCEGLIFITATHESLEPAIAEAQAWATAHLGGELPVSSTERFEAELHCSEVAKPRGRRARDRAYGKIEPLPANNHFDYDEYLT